MTQEEIGQQQQTITYYKELYTYDLLGRRKTLTDGEENTTSWMYDAAGRVLSETTQHGRYNQMLWMKGT